MPTTFPSDEPELEVEALGERFASLRVVDEVALRTVRESLLRHGQLLPLAVHRVEGSADAFEVIDGFKRLRAARELGLARLRVRLLPGDVAAAKAAMRVLNAGHGLTELEEAWLVRSLHREERLTQPQIGRLLARHKSWVSRRLLLAEGLSEVVQGDVRLGLLAARTAEALARLPRGNQERAAEGVMRHGLTHPQTERLVREVLAAPRERRESVLAAALARPRQSVPSKVPPGPRAERTPGQWLLWDVETATRCCSRLQARLCARRSHELPKTAVALVGEALLGLLPLLASLQQTIERHSKGGPDVSMEDAR